MKFIAIIFGFLIVASAVQQDKFKIPENKISKIQKISNSCAAEHSVDPALFPIIIKGELPIEESKNKYMYCFATKAGIVDEGGHIVVGTLAALLGDHPRKEEFKETLTKCADVTKENPVATVVYMNECYFKTSPVILTVE